MDRAELLRVVRALLERPTAPFHEEAVRDEIVVQLQSCARVTLDQDPFGNLIARYRGDTNRPATWAFAAHMDHPAWVRGPDGEFQFLGSVAQTYLEGAARREFGNFAMFDLPPFELKDERLYSRACDDLLGCAEIICTFLELERSQAEVHCLGIFTRAEEVGFAGAIEVAQSQLLPPHLTIFSLETSPPRGGAEMGRGPIVRVGDRLSIFDDAGTAHLVSVAKAAGIPVQRCLLDGGACEASAYQLYGYRCVAASLALGNYHNCAPDGAIACEYVSIDDYSNMVGLCVALAWNDFELADESKIRRLKLEQRAGAFCAFHRPLA